MTVADNILETIGRTPLERPKRVVPPGSARVLVKLEWANPTGSMKDRMARAVIEAAEADGRLRPGGTVVEYTGGSTGVSLALVCAAKGYRLEIVSSDALARRRYAPCAPSAPTSPSSRATTGRLPRRSSKR